MTDEQTYAVVSTSGEDEAFTDYADAVAYANELADELEDVGYACDRSWASRDNYYAVDCRRIVGYTTAQRETIEVTSSASVSWRQRSSSSSTRTWMRRQVW